MKAARDIAASVASACYLVTRKITLLEAIYDLPTLDTSLKWK
jgi:hypothetical protein